MRYYKTLGTSVINSPMSTPFPQIGDVVYNRFATMMQYNNGYEIYVGCGYIDCGKFVNLSC